MESPTYTAYTVSKDLSFLDSRVLLRLKPFDLGGQITRERDAVGTGASCDVFRGVYIMPGRGEVSAALKRMRMYTGKEACKVLFEREIYVWSTLQHSNVLPLLGFAFDDETGYPMLISEWMDNGNALAYVRQTNPGPSTLLNLILDIANGLTYLHEDKGVVHSDIKPENVLIGPNEQAMLCDFGLARMEIATQSIMLLTSTTKGTSNYWAPELLQVQGQSEGSGHSRMSDVWAFGMTAYALYSRQHPFANCYGLAVALSILDGPLPEFPDDDRHASDTFLPHIKQVCTLCWERDAKARPSMSELASLLSKLMQLQNEGKLSSAAINYSLGRISAHNALIEKTHADPFGAFLRIQCGKDHISLKSDQIRAASKHEPPCYEPESGEKGVYFASAEVDGVITPGKATPNWTPMVSVTWKGMELPGVNETFTILPFDRDLMELVPANGSHCVPEGRRPVVGGYEPDGRALYHALAEVPEHSARVPGKAAEHLGGAVVGFYFKEFHITRNYEVLCWKD